jgi:hypothetical protein
MKKQYKLQLWESLIGMTVLVIRGPEFRTGYRLAGPPFLPSDKPALIKEWLIAESDLKKCL